MPITVQLNEQESQRLQELARELQVDPQELAIVAINDLASRSDDDFEQAIQHVLEKNRELYRRLV